MSASPNRIDPPVPHAPAFQKAPRGIGRLMPALRHSVGGLREAWEEAAFRDELAIAVFLLPLAYLIGKTWLETLLLWATLAIVLVVELLNSAIEAAIDRVGLEWHPLSKRAKDLGSAAVLVTIAMVGLSWIAALVYFFAD